MWVEWVIIRGGDALRAAWELARRPFEWLAWAIRRGVIWPLQDRGAGLGVPGRVLAAVAAALIVGVGVAALLSAGSGGGGSEPVAAEVPVATEEPPAVAEPKAPPAEPEPTLQGAAPEFKPAKAEKQRDEVGGDTADVTSAPADSNPATATIGSEPGAATSSASASAAAASQSSPQSSIGIDGPPAGAKAIAVAEDFAGAFVLYETGGEKEKVRQAFKATATPELTKSLLRRPPRQPANVEVPKAKVVNVVAGPSHGGIYSVSVSLLRVGLTSELRLDMEKLKNDWRVTNVLG